MEWDRRTPPDGCKPVAEFPNASNPYDSLAEAYLVAGQRERAITNYRKSLELNPGNVVAASARICKGPSNPAILGP